MAVEVLTLNEALVALLVEQDGVDAGNAVEKYRAAQHRIVEAVWGDRADETTTRAKVMLATPRNEGAIEWFLTIASENGQVDLFEVTA